MFKVDNEDTRTQNTIVNFGHILHLVLVFVLSTLNMYLPTGTRLLHRKIFHYFLDFINELYRLRDFFRKIFV